MEIIIRNRYTGDPIYTAKDVENLCQALTRAVEGGRSLYRADLSGADLSGANLYGANLSGADLSGADLSGANLSKANLSKADLSRAYLSGANLSWANLSRANLSGADLSGANLVGANGINKYATSPMYMLLDQVGEIRAYKLVTKDGHGPNYPAFAYSVGQAYTEPNFEADERVSCGPGINLASLDWCLRNWQPGYRILVASFEGKHGTEDNICVPIGSDGKFRVRSCKIVSEVDLVGIGFLDEKGERK